VDTERLEVEEIDFLRDFALWIVKHQTAPAIYLHSHGTFYAKQSVPDQPECHYQIQNTHLFLHSSLIDRTREEPMISGPLKLAESCICFASVILNDFISETKSGPILASRDYSLATS
jgi:hypothetical protein